MKTILCFGDSNTWGHNPRNCGRFGPEVRWPGVLRKKLGEGFLVIEEGLNGRTTVWDDPIVPVNRSGKAVLPVCLETHKPIDFVIIMLGTNDLKLRFSLPAADIARGAGLLLDLVSHSTAGPEEQPPFCLLISPPHIGEEPAFDGTFGQAREKSKQLAAFYKREVEARQGCFFLDAAEFVETSPLDGVHLSEESHALLGSAVAEALLSILRTATRTL